MEFERLVEKRRSTRVFDGTPMSAETAKELLYAAAKAPNACNYQSWHFYALDQANVWKLVPDIYRGEWILGAGAAFVICTEDKKLAERFGDRGRMFALQDTAAAMTMLLLKAADIGWSGCWLGAFDPENCRKLLEIPTEREPVAIAVIGKNPELPPQRERKPMDAVTTFVGDFGTAGPEETERPSYTLEAGNYSGAVFFDVNLSDAKFNDVSMKNARFNNINMNGVKFTDINLRDSAFIGLTMAGAQFGADDAESICVELNGARFTQVNFTEAVLRQCKLCGVKLEGCDLTGMTIDGMDAADYFKK